MISLPSPSSFFSSRSKFLASFALFEQAVLPGHRHLRDSMLQCEQFIKTITNAVFFPRINCTQFIC